MVSFGDPNHSLSEDEPTAEISRTVSLGDLHHSLSEDEPTAEIGRRARPRRGVWRPAGRLARTADLGYQPSRFAHQQDERRVDASLGSCASTPTPEE